MVDHLEEQLRLGIAAGTQVVDDLLMSHDIDAFYEAVKTAISNDTRFNFHLIEEIGSLATMGRKASLQAKMNE